VKEKAGLCTDFAPSCVTYLLLWGSSCHFQNSPPGPCFRCQLYTVYWQNLGDWSHKKMRGLLSPAQ
jgi:hypothetical protein